MDNKLSGTKTFLRTGGKQKNGAQHIVFGRFIPLITFNLIKSTYKEKLKN